MDTYLFCSEGGKEGGFERDEGLKETQGQTCRYEDSPKGDRHTHTPPTLRTGSPCDVWLVRLQGEGSQT